MKYLGARTVEIPELTINSSPLVGVSTQQTGPSSPSIKSTKVYQEAERLQRMTLLYFWEAFLIP